MSLSAGLLPHRPPVDEPDHETRVVTLDTEEAAALCRSLGSETATAILDRLFDEPTTASGVAERVDTSLQNAHYHLERLQEAGLVEVVDTWYSSRGVEMSVYAAVYDEFVIVPATDDDERGVDARRNADARRSADGARSENAEGDERDGRDGKATPVATGPPP